MLQLCNLFSHSDFSVLDASNIPFPWSAWSSMSPQAPDFSVPILLFWLTSYSVALIPPPVEVCSQLVPSQSCSSLRPRLLASLSSLFSSHASWLQPLPEFCSFHLVCAYFISSRSPASTCPWSSFIPQSPRFCHLIIILSVMSDFFHTDLSRSYYVPESMLGPKHICQAHSRYAVSDVMWKIDK